MNYLAFKYSLGSKMRWKKNMKKWPNIMKCISYDSQFIQRVVVLINRSLQSYQQVLSNKRSLMKRLCIKLFLHWKNNPLFQNKTKQSVTTCQWRTIMGITLIDKFKLFFFVFMVTQTIYQTLQFNNQLEQLLVVGYFMSFQFGRADFKVELGALYGNFHIQIFPHCLFNTYCTYHS